MASLHQAAYAAISGAQTQTNIIAGAADDAANVETFGHKGKKTFTADVAYFLEQLSAVGQNAESTNSSYTGLGSKVTGTVLDLAKGSLKTTNSPFDLFIQSANEFLVVETGNGQQVYTRDGSLRLDNEGTLVTQTGAIVQGNIQIPIGTDPNNVNISADGRVLVTEGADVIEVGRIPLATFPNAESLMPIGNNLLQESNKSGAPILGFPREGDFDGIISRAVEGSNVNMMTKMVELMNAQTSYQFAVRVAKDVGELEKSLAQL